MKASRQSGVQPRAHGRLQLSCARRGPKSEISKLHQKGSVKALFPRSPLGHLDAVFLNTAGGITGGDVYEYALDVGQGSSLRITSQAAERIYKAPPGQTGSLNVTARIEDGASLQWLPQETIVFDEARLRRTLTVEMSETAKVLCVEPIIFGRSAMGETVQSAQIWDDWRVRLGGDLIFADATRIDGEVHQTLSDAAIADGCVAMATILLVSGDADVKLKPLRRALGPSGGASLIREGVLFARVLASDGFSLRQSLIPAIEALTDMQIPKNWRI